MHDVVIIGGGHNGLVCSAYLAMAGFKIVVLDQRHVVGGAAVTEEFSPGFANSVASYTVSLLNPKIIRDLDLILYRLPFEPEDHSRPRSSRARTAHHRASDIEFPAAGRQTLSEGRRRPNETAGRKILAEGRR